VAGVPLTKPWFLGLANVRGNLYSVVDLARFLGREAIVTHGGGGQSRLILFGPRAGDMNVGVVVQAVLGLRNVAELTPVPSLPDAPAWYGERWTDAEGGAWQEFDLARLAADPEFLRVGL
jgi:twitching motility protein PilI